MRDALTPCECGFYKRDAHHSRTGGGQCLYYEMRKWATTTKHGEAAAEVLALLRGEEKG